MSSAFLTVVLAILWAGITNNFSGLNLLFGALIGGMAIVMLRYSIRQRGSLRKAAKVLALTALFFRELMASALRVAYVVLHPNLKAVVKPAIVAVPLTVKSDAEITLLANMITLTPGTLSIDVSKDRSVLYVHALSMEDDKALIADIANGFEARIKEVFN
ncbi:multicomponent Na+:H+ antiporter subunit E [Devosia crocina]|uniref:Multicomponent Na+:H+ antiporter subunit E n=1 Tax=Devosia crocina TaxID=429728 RepID=A0A1I7NMY2_9HYPH|nr:Na+/H+ antiporter subunit E [Devosia crocina]SFV35979.1 multicomponent Na+:H+ antiporter subunit E [Devosia crocina]